MQAGGDGFKGQSGALSRDRPGQAVLDLALLGSIIKYRPAHAFSDNFYFGRDTNAFQVIDECSDMHYTSSLSAE